MKSQKYSQNFIKNVELIDYLIHKDSMTEDDIVVEIGSGTGNITQRLAKFSKKVIAVEKDKNLYHRTKEKVSKFDNVKVIHKDFLKIRLPTFEYKVFANIPFGITSAILKKLLKIGKSPLESYLFVQQEAAERFVNEKETTQIAVLNKPYFTFKVMHTFKSRDFYPKPKVNVGLLKIKKRSKYLIPVEQRDKYRKFIKSAFDSKKRNISKFMKTFLDYNDTKKCARQMRVSLSAKPSEISFIQWMKFYKYIKRLK